VSLGGDRVKQLAQLYTQIVAEGVFRGSACHRVGIYAQLKFPSSLLLTISVVQFLRTLPVPMTHPLHPAAPGIFNTFKEAQLSYVGTGV